MDAESRHFKGAGEAMSFVTHALMAVPIPSREGKQGILKVVNKTGGGDYTEEDLPIPAIAISNLFKNVPGLANAGHADAACYILIP